MDLRLTFLRLGYGRRARFLCLRLLLQTNVANVDTIPYSANVLVAMDNQRRLAEISCRNVCKNIPGYPNPLLSHALRTRRLEFDTIHIGRMWCPTQTEGAIKTIKYA
ncbi:hypothetical protein B0H19DRAFT_706865 [Mycena capillaripes]|nr:hypothetical protein B0H19DRAFT_706865 [Mycena capillaripes]